MPTNEFTEVSAMLDDFDAFTTTVGERLDTKAGMVRAEATRIGEVIAALKGNQPMTVAEKAAVVAKLTATKGRLDGFVASIDDEVELLKATGVDPVDPTPTVEVNTVNQLGADNGIGAVGDIIANDNPNLAQYKSNSWVDTTTV